MCGIALKRAGHCVTILDKDGDVRQSHMAGVCLGLDAARYLERHDHIATAFSYPGYRVQSLKPDLSAHVFVKGRRDITSWDAFYFRLRANFDGYKSSFCPTPAPSSATDGQVAYNGSNEVLGLKRDNENDKMVLTVRDGNTQEVSEKEADLVIGADGPSSVVRAQYLPDCKREYVGYIAWRGTVAESQLTESTRNILKGSVTINLMRRNHMIIYMIPGIDGSLEPGEKYVNFLWYTNETPEALNEIMIDGVDGHRHRNTVPSGRVRADLWEARLEVARKASLPAPLLEVIENIQEPFIQAITDFVAPQAAFEDGKVLLMGDALSQYRPHTAFSGTQAAFHAMSIEDYVAGKLSLEDWEERVLRFSHLHWSQSATYGTFYQYHPVATLIQGVSYLWLCGFDRITSWWKGEERLLRGLSYGKLDDEDEH